MGQCVTCGGRTPVDATLCEVCQLAIDQAKGKADDATVFTIRTVMTRRQAEAFVTGMTIRYQMGHLDEHHGVDRVLIDMTRTLKQLMGEA